jgi:HPt (histidine-containing phosphotransfer) domain-containing protein
MSTPEPAFDWAQASSLLGDDPNNVDGEMAQIARELVDGAEVQFAEMKAKNADTERKEISSVAHALRGCLLNFGFTEVGKILVDIEKGPPFTDAEYRVKLDNAYAAFLTSKKMLADRYPSVGLS